MAAPVRDSEFLAFWEAGVGEHPLDRATLFASWIDGVSREVVAGLSLDQRDRALFRFCSGCFGPSIELTLACEECGEESEVTFEIADVLGTAVASDEFSIAHCGRELTCRQPDSHDLASAISADNPRLALLSRLIETDAPDETLLSAVEQQMTEHAGLAAFSIANACPQCGHVTDTPFDILDFVWKRVSAEARRTLKDIDVLARAYGWSSSEILALSPQRRAAHIAMVQS